MLPGTDGIELMKDILRAGDVPVIFLSAYGRDELIARGFDMEAVDYVVKPFSPTELAARVRAALRKRAASEPSEPYVLGDLTIDYAERRVSLASRPLPLIAMEYRLLAELSANAGRLLTYEHLLERVWGETYSPRDALAAERGDEREVLLRGRLRAALLRLNEWLNDAQADRVIFELENINAIGMAPAMFSAAPDHILALLSQTMQNIDQVVTHYEDALALCRKAGHRPELAWTYCDYADTLLERNEPGRPRAGHVPAGRVSGHLQRVGHAALDGAGAVAAGDIEGVVLICPRSIQSWRWCT